MSVSQSPSLPSSSAGKGLSIRSLLPFGPNRSITQVSPAVLPKSHNLNVFGSFRRSLSVVRPAPLPEPNVIDISQEVRKERRSLSLSDIQKPLPDPSEAAPEPANLSTIIEADTSGLSLSKHLPSPSPSPAPPESSNESSVLDLSTARISAEVLDAMISKDYATAGSWSTDIKVIDVSSDSLDMDDVDPDLATLLSPNNLSQKNKSVDLTIQVRSQPSPGASPVPSPAPSNLLQRFSQAQSSSSSSSLNTRPVRSTNGSTEEPVRRAPPSPLSSHTSDRVSACAGTPPSLPSSRSKGKERERVFSPPDAFPASRSSLDIPRVLERDSPSPDVQAFVDAVGVPRSTSTPITTTRSRKRSMSVEYASPHLALSRTFHSVRARQSPSEAGDRPRSAGRKVEMGPRTLRAFRAAGLLGDETSPSSITSRGSTEFSRRAPSRMHSEIGISDLAMVSPPNGRQSRMTQSEWRSPSVPDSSPTTHSSRDTPRSVSTAPTSLTSTSHSRENDWMREEIEQLRDKHAVESAALLAALSDSQRITRVLREENEELRQRLARLERDFEERQRLDEMHLVERLNEMEQENERLKRLVRDQQKPEREVNLLPRSRYRRQQPPPIPFQLELDGPSFDLDIPAIGMTSTPVAETRQRKVSSSSRASSVFQIPPSDMSLLLHDNINIHSDGERSGMSVSPLEDSTLSALGHRHKKFFPIPAPIHTQQRHISNKSISSVTSVLTRSSKGSPKSLFPLRPEDEIHLGDLGGVSLMEDSETSSVL